MPDGVNRVLDVGCGAGATGYAIKHRSGAEVIGVALDTNAAGQAEERLDSVITDSLEELDDNAFPAGHFDCILCADVLEHMVDPWDALRKLHCWLSDDGVLIASLPNLRHITAELKTLTDRWEYDPAGDILDKTHLRFFTLRTMLNMFAETGYRVETIRTNASTTMKFKAANVIALGTFRPFTVFQYRIAVRKRDS